MRFQLWGNSRVHISLFEPVEMDHQCRRAWDLIGIDVNDHEMIDSIIVGGSSRLLHKKHGLDKSSAEINKVVHKQPSPTPEAEAVESGIYSPHVQPLYDPSVDPLDATVPTVAALGFM